MGFTKRILEDELEKRFEEYDVDSLILFTNTEAKRSKTEERISYRIFGEIDGSHFSLIDGFWEAPDCRCFDCADLGSDLDELYDIYAGLCHITEEFPRKPVYVWVSSELIARHGINSLFALAGDIDCQLLMGLRTGVHRLFSELEIIIEEYGYGNKDAIPVFF